MLLVVLGCIVFTINTKCPRNLQCGVNPPEYNYTVRFSVASTQTILTYLMLLKNLMCKAAMTLLQVGEVM
jgi:hypothetical protein